MASGTINYNTTDSNYKMRLTWSSTTNESTFKSTVTYQLQAYRTADATTMIRYQGSVKFINNDSGETVLTKSVNATMNVQANSWITVVSGTFTISHNATSGLAPVLVIGGTITDSYATYTIPSENNTIRVDAIATPATLVSAPNFTDTSNPTITYSNPSGSAVTSLQACIANDIGTEIYAAYRNIEKTGSSYTFSLTSAERTTLRAAMSDTTSIQVRFYVKTVARGETHYSFLTRTLTISGGEPNLSPAVTVTDSTTTTLTGRTDTIIPGFSDISYTIGATGQKGATIISQSVTCDKETKYEASGTYSDIHSPRLTFECTDSRGKSATAEVNLYAIAYVKVTCNQSVRLNLDGTVDLTITGNYFNESFGAQDNTLTVEIRHREDGGAWGEWGSITPLISDISGGTYTLTAAITGFDPSGTYEFQSRATDKLITAYSGDSSIVLSPIFDWSRTDFNFNVPVTMNGQTVLRHNETANNLVVSASGGFIYLRPGGTSDTTAEVLITPQGNIQLSGDIIINGKSLKSLLGIE